MRSDPSAPMGHDSGAPTVLVVDDDARNRLLLTAWLGRSHTVVEAADGTTALELLDRVDPDVVLLDVMMPGVDGIETCRRIKARVQDGYRPVVLLTALGEQSSRNAGLEAGADDFLSKPVDQRELVLRLRTFITLRRQDRIIRRQLGELQRVHELKDDLVSLVTHDLRNALGGVMILLEGAQLSTGTCGGRDLATVLSAMGRMNETLDDMLRLKQLEDDALPLRLEPVLATELVESAVALAEPGARARGIAFARDVPPGLRIVGDALLLRRGLFNLLQNAVKFSPKNATVDIVVAARDGRIWLEVLDRGPGIPEDVRPHLFEKYAGVAHRRAHPRSGNGLGLFLVQLVARAHGGEVMAHARDGGGSVFLLTLPAG